MSEEIEEEAPAEVSEEESEQELTLEERQHALKGLAGMYSYTSVLQHYYSHSHSIRFYQHPWKLIRIVDMLNKK